jgi:hypothetical protein
MLPEVTLINHVGGVQRSDKPYCSPRYSRCSISKEIMLQELRNGSAVLQLQAAGSTASSTEGFSAEHVDGSTVVLQAGGTGKVGSTVVPQAGGSTGGSNAQSDGPISHKQQQQQQTKQAVHEAPAGPPASACIPLHSSHPVELVAASLTVNDESVSANSSSEACANCSYSSMKASHTALHHETFTGTLQAVPGSSAAPVTFGSSRQLAVDVLVPTARLDLELLQGIADAVL